MKIIVVGGGKIGQTILSNLVREGHDVTLVDNDPSVITELTNIHDVIGVCGNGSDCQVLSEADVEHTKLLISVTGSDELNMLCCFLGRRMGARHTIARIRNPEYNDQSLLFMKKQLNLSMALNPELLTAGDIFNMLRLPSAVNIERFSARNMQMVELVLRDDSPLCNNRLADLRKSQSALFLICAVSRGEEVIIPDGDFVLQCGDHIILAASSSELQKLLKNMGLSKRQARSVMILGASRTAFYLARMLLKSGCHVKIVDQNAARCEELNELLPDAVIIKGDGASKELLMEEGLTGMDAFVALTGMDEENILISCFAASNHVSKAIAKVNREELNDMAEKLGLDTLVSPQSTVLNVVSRYARALENSEGNNKIETLYKLLDGRAEALEFIVSDDFSHLEVPLKNMLLKKGTLIAAILRDGKTIIPSGDDVIHPGDRVIVVTAGNTFLDLADIIR